MQVAIGKKRGKGGVGELFFTPPPISTTLSERVNRQRPTACLESNGNGYSRCDIHIQWHSITCALREVNCGPNERCAKRPSETAQVFSLPRPSPIALGSVSATDKAPPIHHWGGRLLLPPSDPPPFLAQRLNGGEEEGVGITVAAQQQEFLSDFPPQPPLPLPRGRPPTCANRVSPGKVARRRRRRRRSPKCRK